MSLVAWLPLNGNLNNQGIGTITTSGTPSYNTGKLSTQALNLSTRITGNIPELVGAKTWSIAFWCLTKDDDTLSSDWVDILGVHDRKSDDSATGEFRWETCYGSTKASVAIGQYNNGTYATMTTNGGTLVTTKGAWHHCVAVADFENSKVDVYCDGVLKYTKVHAGGWLLGDYWLGQNNAVNGSIQDVRFYNHALSVKEVKELAKGLCVYISLDWGANPNLAINSQTLNGFSGKSNFTGTNSNYLDSNGVRICKALCSAESTGGPYCSVFSRSSTVPAVNGTTYTWSMYIRANRNMTKNIGHECGGTMAVNITTEWQYVTKTWTYNTSNYQAIVFYGNSGDNKWLVDDWIEIKNLKIEEGSVATPYIPNTAETLYTEKQYAKKFAEDCSGYYRELSILSAPTNGGTSVRGITCTHFDGSDDGVSFTDSTFYNQIANANTIAFWINSEDAGDRSVYFSHYAGSGWSMAFEKTTSNTLRLYWNGNPDYTNSSFTITDGEWIHIAIVRESATSTKFYKNGSLVNTYTTTCANPTSGASIYYLGRDVRTGATCYKGYMSDFRFYATALTANDIKELYNVGASIDKSGKIYCGSLIEV